MNRLVALMPIEMMLTLGFIALTAVISISLDLPVSLPTGNSAAFVGVHYLFPLIGIAIWAGIVILGRTQPLGMTFLIAFPCYAAILLCHFNLKLWIPQVNPALWDAHYWAIDQALHPLVDWAMRVRVALAPVIPLDSNFYMLGFIALFYLSFGYHALKTPTEFRELVVAAMLLQIIGSLAYFIAPALGPFIYQTGVEPPVTAAQEHMLGVWQAVRNDDGSWLATNGGANLTAGIAAMPSLHAGGSLLFLVFAWRHAQGLLPLMVPLFGFITIDAIANRWHYLIDLPFGMALAVAAIWLAKFVVHKVPIYELLIGKMPDLVSAKQTQHL